MINANKAPTLSVCVATYNQEGYIRECLQSIINQTTNFEYEVLVSDDCSSDQTKLIIEDFARLYPGIVKPHYHKKNIGAFQNFTYVHSLASGEYIAHLDGDDLMLPGKLQAQYEFMAANPDCMISWHRMIIDDIENKIYSPQHYQANKFRSKKIYIDDILSYITLGIHSSKMYRNIFNQNAEIPIPSLDFSANVLHLYRSGGYAAFLPTSQAYGVYRKSVGISRSTASIRKIIYSWYDYFFENKIGSPYAISSKIFLMVISDAARRVGSFPKGVFLLIKMLKFVSPKNIIKIRTNRIEDLISMATVEK